MLPSCPPHRAPAAAESRSLTSHSSDSSSAAPGCRRLISPRPRRPRRLRRARARSTAPCPPPGEARGGRRSRRLGNAGTARKDGKPGGTGAGPANGERRGRRRGSPAAEHGQGRADPPLHAQDPEAAPCRGSAVEAGRAALRRSEAEDGVLPGRRYKEGRRRHGG